MLTTDDGYVDREQIRRLAGQVVELKKMGYDVVVVSSGAIGSGMGENWVSRKDLLHYLNYRRSLR